MKIPIFALIIAAILQDHGAFQETPVDQCDDIQLVGLFKKYAVGLVDAAVESLGRNEDFLERGCECFTGIDVFERVNPTDAILATISIAKYHQGELKLVQSTPTSALSGIMSGVGPGMMVNIRLILLFLQTSQEQVDLLARSRTYLKYLTRHNEGASIDDDTDIESRLKCYQILIGIESYGFFDNLYKGFELIRQLMTRDDNEVTTTRDPRRDEVIALIKESSRYQIQTPRARSKEELKSFLEFISRN